ncbi:protein-L-isoaspartate(D-aspartate) O-methyltransferase [Streptomyces sp. LHD-70]|uniref:methyltransferase domain-containing protein n=1 Tax=Streptomyces sp. LHD-70 TaxID=3072140 RepID=UPI00280F9884|nr:methyltransferase domain-containing protein [Streptomyces sp. LHD-70]MDQ8707225.1 protein-L-isoaspartate(D-aspartate) O-methyltransferase [Streptomyces sp. LHD-70]
MTPHDPEEARRRRTALAELLAANGDLTDPAWRTAFEKVPRHVFVPEIHTGPDEPPLTAVHADWLSLVYTDEALVTQLTDGVATSSSTAPGLMLAMLHALDVTDGLTVLEVATGTGYNAALLAARLGSANVTTIEVDPGLALLADVRLRACGQTPTVRTGDGRAGHAARAPYDRLIATCGFTAVPYPWVRQVRPGGLIVCPLGSGTARLVVGDDGTAAGQFLRTPSYFMGVRAADETGAAPYPGDPGTADERLTGLDPAVPAGSDSFPFLLSLALPGAATSTDLDDTGQVTGCRMWTADGSWARASTRTVRQAGPGRLWDVVEDAYDWWLCNGRPVRERFGATVTRAGTAVWLDRPDQPVPHVTYARTTAAHTPETTARTPHGSPERSC